MARRRRRCDRIRARTRTAPRGQVVRTRRRAALREPDSRPRLDPCADRRERRGQVDARQDHRRALPPRRGRIPARRRAGRLHEHRAVQGGRHRRDLPGADALPRPVGHREHLHGPPAHQPHRAHRPHARCATRPTQIFNRLGVALDPERITEGLSIADQQIIEIAKAISLDARGADHGRADRRALGRRGRATLRRRPEPARRGSRAPVHLAPLRRGLRAVRHRDGHARRLVRRHDADRRDDASTSSCARWSAAT